MFYVMERAFTAEGVQVSSEDIDTYATEAEANAKIEILYEPCRTVGIRWMHDDGGWSVFYVDPA